MTQENKELLLRDLSARLTYGFIVHRYSDTVDISIDDIDDFAHFLEYSEGEEFKPYLRPLSSMTKEERNEYHSYCDYYYGTYFDTVGSIDWLNKKMFAYRTINGKDMFELGLALEAPEGMYK